MISHKIIKKTSSTVIFSVEVDSKFIEPLKKATLDKLKKNLKVAGFREGNIPDNIAEREIGDAQLQTEVMEAAINKSYIEITGELKLDVISQPKIEIKKFVPYSQMEYQCEVALMPEIKLDYKKIRVKEEEAKINQADIDGTIESLRHQIAQKKVVTRSAQKGDELKIDFEGKREGKPIEGAAAQNQQIVIGEDQFIPGFETNLIGLKAGDKKEFELSFPKDYAKADLASKKVIFNVKVHEVREIELPKVDDDFAKKIGNFKNLPDLKKDIEQKLIENQKDHLKKEYEKKVINEVVDKAKVDLPQPLVDEQLKRLRDEVENNLKNSGLDTKKYLEIQGKTQKQLDDELMQEAHKRVKIALVIKKVVEEEKLKVSPAEVDEEISRLKVQYSDPETVKKIDDPDFRFQLSNHLLSNKAIAKLVSFAK